MFGVEYIQLRGFHDYVLVRLERGLDPWLARGFVPVPPEYLFGSLGMAFDHGTPRKRYAEVWRQLFPSSPLPATWGPHDVLLELARMARAPIPRLYVLERRIERGIQLDPPEFKSPPLPPRTATDHYIVIEAVTDTKPPKPVTGVRLELLIADGEIKHAQTDANGVARIERIQAGRVVIRVLNLDGALWRPLEGEASQPSSSSERPLVHVTRRGECLSKIAHSYGLGNWQRVWDHPHNAGLREQRRTPHLLLPGDEVTVPAISVHEIARPTDAAHKIIVARAPATFQAVLQDHNQRAFKHQPYELSLPGHPEEALKRGTTDERGGISETLPAETERVEVRLVRLGLSWSFALSHMAATPGDKVRREVGEGRFAHMAVAAAQARLNALGFASGAVDGKLGPRTRAALSLQQAGATSEPHAELSEDVLRTLDDGFLA